MKEDRVNFLIKQMTLHEKASLCSGLNNADTKPIERLGLPALKMHDGPNGLRREDESVTDSNFGGYKSVPAICFPSGCALASSWSESLLEQLAELLAEECHAEELPVLLGPAINIKRSPLCGRNFEYFSEDPYLAGKLAAAYIRSLQKNGIGAGLKHFAANNQERRRQSVDSVIDERTLREIYLAGFEIAVKEGDPWTVMCAYNRLNGDYCCENEWLLQKVLRDEWGYKGFVLSDWGAVNDRVKSLAAGLELEMPYSGPENDEEIEKTVNSGKLPMEILDRAVGRMLPIIERGVANQKKPSGYNKEEHHKAARAMACECSVLLKNHNNILPLKQDGYIAVLGQFAKEARYQGGGAAHVLASIVDSPFEEIKKYASCAKWAAGYPSLPDDMDSALIEESITLAKASQFAIVFAGLCEEQESEAFDREDMKMPQSHVKLIEAVAKANPNTIVVLMAGSPVEMEWESKVKAILHVNLGGEAIGGAIADMLFGISCPSGRLAESYPYKLEHNPSFISFGADENVAEYREGVFVGYRYYTSKNLPVRYPFGYGLTYTAFEYSDIRLSKDRIWDDEPLEVKMTLRNIGTRDSSEVVQLYVRGKTSRVKRPDRELKGFKKVHLAAGEEKEVTFTLNQRAFAYYDTSVGSWYAESGSYEILIGASCEDNRLTSSVSVTARSIPLPGVDENTVVGDILQSPQRKKLLEEMLQTWAPKVYDHYAVPKKRTECATLEMIWSQYLNMTLRGLRLSSEGSLSKETLQAYMDRMNRINNTVNLSRKF